ncbi:MAG: Cell division protein FtsI [Thermodesulfobacterium sp.]|uniref:Cell division protein FtsI n=1 Tax=Candidatus Thermodesulfobacterium syntrophicum TaxID=3060442 RepID=A0AAE3P3W1_9BACT|nr:Cell division protein FtsI [Candidatus Thermodesulfobacterium syntrophicum]
MKRFDPNDFLIRDFFKTKQKILKGIFWEKRLFWAKFLIIFSLAILWFRFFYLQVVKYSYYYKKAKERSVVSYVIKAPRGEIVTSDGVIVATNRAVFQLYLDPELIKDREDAVLYKLSKILKEDFGILKERYYLAKKTFLGRVLIKRNLNWDEVAKIMVRRYYLPGVKVEVEAERYYPYGDMYFHLIGYISKITMKEYKKLKEKGYSMEDYIGRAGIEKEFEKELKGKNGAIEIERDAYGRLGKVINRISPVPGNDLVLTVNHNLQVKAYELMKGKRGALVALSPQDGSLLAMVSSPSINPQKFINGFTKEEWKRINQNPDNPFLNRVLQPYPPGSTYKVITAIAGLEAGIIKNVNDTVFCSGYYKFKNRIFRCWKPEGHKSVNLIKAIAYSCDVYFYTVASKLDIDYLAEVSRKWGLGKPTGLGWSEEKSGFIPDRAWKEKTFKEPWYPGETIIIGIGQGYLLATPLQMARVYMAIANGGYLYKPYAVKKIKRVNGNVIEIAPQIEKHLILNSRYLEWIREGLLEAVRIGTGRGAFIPGLLVSGKTGTAQVVSLSAKTKKDKSLEHHAWFVSYAGWSQPQIVSAILVEHGGHGGAVAAPIAQKLYKTYFGIEEPKKNITKIPE